MTGYGRCRLEADGREMTLEIKTVNHRFLDVSLRLPRGFLFLEDTLRRALAEHIARGHADLFLTYVNHREDAVEVEADLALLAAYGRAFDRMAEALPLRDDRTLTDMARLPDVLKVTQRDEDEEALTKLALDALEGACGQLTRMREREGAALAADLGTKIDTLCGLTAQMKERAPGVVADYRDRLSARITELLASPPDPQRLAQEVAFFADRAAIDEELTRLDSHFAQFRACLAQAEPAGKKLDFLTQEMNREVNTIGSKASDLALTQLVVAAKAEIEKIREQVQNVE